MNLLGRRVVEERVAVLLGAGASVDAGLPMSTGLTQQLVENLGNELGTAHDRSVLNALHFVCSAMIGHRGLAGESPFAGINVETMFSAVRLLSTRAEHEAAPFVSNWLPGVEALDAHPVVSLDSEINKAISAAIMGNPGTSLTRLISDVARASLRPGDGSVYRKLESKLLPVVCSVLAQHQNTSYLKPLADLAKKQEGGLDVATLNYDLTLESMCNDAALAVETGMDKWTPGHPLVFDEGTSQQIRLFKLHGSIDWSYQVVTPEPSKSERFIRTLTVVKADPSRNSMPAIVIGDREKLGGDGPTLALVREFEQRLDKANRLVVVGYSFGDNHVNAVIRNWINTGRGRALTVVDPSWPRDTGLNSFQRELVEGLIGSYGFRSPTLPPKMNVIRKTAALGLEEALAEGPGSNSGTELFLLITEDPGAEKLVLRVHNSGPDVEKVFVSSGGASFMNGTIRGFVRRNSGGETQTMLGLGDLPRGSFAEAEISLHHPPGPGGEEIMLACETSTGRRHHIYDVNLQTRHAKLRA